MLRMGGPRLEPQVSPAGRVRASGNHGGSGRTGLGQKVPESGKQR